MIGTAHRQRDLVCQDASAGLVTESGRLLIAVADGAGSASRADVGASAAVAAAMDHVSRIGAVNPADAVRGAVDAARAALFERATEDIGDLATTLIVLVADAEQLATAQVGDGAVVIRRHGLYEVVGPAERGEYLNETCFLTSEGWDHDLRVDAVEIDGVDACAAMTDGLQLLAFDMTTGKPHPGFFGPLMDWTASATAEPDELESFLASPRVCQRTDDDKTIVLAALAPPSEA